MRKLIDGVLSEMTPEEQAAFDASRPAAIADAVPSTITRSQFFREAASRGKMTVGELRSITKGVLPNRWSDAIAASVQGEDQLDAELTILTSWMIRRNSAFVTVLKTVLGLDDDAVDAFWKAASRRPP